MSKIGPCQNEQGVNNDQLITARDEKQQEEPSMKDIVSEFLSSTGCHGCNKLADSSKQKRCVSCLFQLR